MTRNLPLTQLFTAIICTLAVLPALARDEPQKLDEARAAAWQVMPERERKLRLDLRRRLVPLLDRELAASERETLQAALKAAASGGTASARTAQAKLSEAAARKLVDWQLLVSGTGTVTQFREFMDANPMWPERDLMQQRFEQALLRDGAGARKIKSFFEKAPPMSGPGLAALASAELALGNESAAKRLAAQAWCHHRIARSIEQHFLQRFSKHLSLKDHKCRLDRLLVSNPRSRWARRSRAAAASRVAKLLPGGEQLKARARIAVYLGRRNGIRLLRRVVRNRKLVAGDWGLAYQRILRSRKRDDHSYALKLLKAVPGEADDLVNRDNWWEERHIHALYVLRSKGNTAKQAYELVRDVRPEDVNVAKDQALFAGWLALQRLDRPKDAGRHFQYLAEKADGPLSRSTAQFWLARTSERLGDKAQAAKHYEKAQGELGTFHALLARRALAPDSRRLPLPEARSPTADETKRFLANEAVRALVIASRLQLKRRTILDFYRQLARTLESEGELVLLAQLADELGDGQAEVRTGKAGIFRGFNLYEFAYPVHRLPAYEPLREPAEKALLMAIARQESEFNTRIVSHAGARGVLQVMPITAKDICRQYKIKCDVRRLLSDPSYNTKIASAYVADRYDDFSGSYILTLTGFNAGPGRTRQWLRQFGDPRAPDVKPLGWVYRIPFDETRAYVRKVLSNLQVYRARLGETDPLRIDLDLQRGRKS